MVLDDTLKMEVTAFRMRRNFRNNLLLSPFILERAFESSEIIYLISREGNAGRFSDSKLTYTQHLHSNITTFQKGYSSQL